MMTAARWDTALIEKQRPEAEQKPIERRQIGCAAARSVDDQELLLQDNSRRRRP